VITFRTLGHTPAEDIRLAFNEAFSDYVVPLQFTSRQFENKLRGDRASLDFSAGAFDGARLVGFIIHGHDADNPSVVYNGGTGVVPGYRGQGLTSRIYDFLWPIFRERAISTVMLEVIITNQYAVRVYKALGFKTLRDLDCYKGTLECAGHAVFTGSTLISTYDWQAIKNCWAWQPTWQNAVNAVEGLRESTVALVRYREDQLIAYLIFNPVTARVHQFAVHPDFRRQGLARAMFCEIFSRGFRDIAVINVDAGSAGTAAFLSSMGLRRFATLHEMKLEI
jgi:ribosomal protein S18 acetylase RimI-like enzyme